VKSDLKRGVCVSCGRESRNLSRVCPYCSETVWQPFWLRAARAVTLVTPWALCVWIATSGGYDLRDWLRELAEMPLWTRGMCAFGFAALLLPSDDRTQVLNSTRSLWRFQAQATAGNLLLGLPVLWLGVFLKQLCLTPLDAWRAAAAGLLCFCGMLLRQGSTSRLLVSAAIFLAAGMTRVLL